MILIYNEARAVFFGKHTLIPGTNVVGDDFDLTHPTISEMLSDGRLERVDKTPAAQKCALSRAFTKKTVDSIAAASKDAGVKEAAKRRSKELDDIDKEWSEGLEGARGDKSKIGDWDAQGV